MPMLRPYRDSWNQSTSSKPLLSIQNTVPRNSSPPQNAPGTSSALPSSYKAPPVEDLEEEGYYTDPIAFEVSGLLHQNATNKKRTAQLRPEPVIRSASAPPAAQQNVHKSIPAELFETKHNNATPSTQEHAAFLQPLRYSLPRPAPAYTSKASSKGTAKSPTPPAQFTRTGPAVKSPVSPSLAPVAELPGRKSSTAFTSSISPTNPSAPPTHHPALAGTTSEEIARNLRPVPDFIELMRQIAPILGDPGTAVPHFGQKPSKSIFLDSKDEGLKREMNEHDPRKFLNEKEVNGETTKKQVWRGAKFIPRKFKGGEDVGLRNKHGLKLGPGGIPFADDRDTEQRWKGRQWSVNPHIKTRNLNFEVLEERISHQKLMSLDLNVDARRDAMLIGGRADDFGEEKLEKKEKERHEQRPLVKELPSSSIDFPASAPEMINPPLPQSNPWWYSTQTRRRKEEEVRKSSMSLATLPSSRSRSRSHNSRNEKGENAGDGDGYDLKTRRFVSHGPDGSFEAGRYGNGGIMNWRLVKVTAKVDVVDSDGKTKTEDASAWYCIPNKAMGGWF